MLKRTLILVVILILFCVLMLYGCEQSGVEIIYNPETKLFWYKRTGDFEGRDLKITLPDKTEIELESFKSENTAYKEGIQAAKDVVNNALDKISAGVQ